MSKLLKRRKNNTPEFFIELFRPPKIVIQSPSHNVNKQFDANITTQKKIYKLVIEMRIIIIFV